MKLTGRPLSRPGRGAGSRRWPPCRTAQGRQLHPHRTVCPADLESLAVGFSAFLRGGGLAVALAGGPVGRVPLCPADCVGSAHLFNPRAPVTDCAPLRGPYPVSGGV